MNKNQILTIIKKAVNACIAKNAIAFSALFSQEGELILNRNQKIFKSEIEKVTAGYFSNLEYVNIDIHGIVIEENKAFVEWSWEDYNLLNQQKNCHDNVIALNFKEGLISSWKEYKS